MKKSSDVVIYGFNVLVSPQRTNVGIEHPSSGDIFGKRTYDCFLAELLPQTDARGIVTLKDESIISTSTAQKDRGAIWVSSKNAEQTAKAAEGVLLTLWNMEYSILSQYYDKRNAILPQILESIEALALPQIISFLDSLELQSETNILQFESNQIKGRYNNKVKQINRFNQLLSARKITSLSDVILDPALIS